MATRSKSAGQTASAIPGALADSPAPRLSAEQQCQAAVAALAEIADRAYSARELAIQTIQDCGPEGAALAACVRDVIGQIGYIAEVVMRSMGHNGFLSQPSEWVFGCDLCVKLDPEGYGLSPAQEPQSGEAGHA